MRAAIQQAASARLAEALKDNRTKRIELPWVVIEHDRRRVRPSVWIDSHHCKFSLGFRRIPERQPPLTPLLEKERHTGIFALVSR